MPRWPLAETLGGGVQSDVLPLRPLTLGELLDAAVALLRTNGRVYIGAGLLLAAAEQALLHQMRVAADARPPMFLPDEDRLGEYWLLIVTGLATEAAIIALLGGLAARGAVAALLGTAPTARDLLRPSGGRLLSLLVLAAAAGTVIWFAAAACWLPWLFVYGLLGSLAPAVVIDRLGPGPAILRSLRLTTRAGLRGIGLRLIGYLAWLAIRLALGFGSVTLLSSAFGGLSEEWLMFAAAVAWCAVNAVAYPALACLDAVLHLETRMRVEGLDLALSRARVTGRSPQTALVVPR